MAETFYTVLGVEDDADAEAIRRAYRNQVKEHHPDVSDDPDAHEQFKRLTTARDVLVDEKRRSRYDRLGHDEYVSQHVESGAWTTDDERGDDSRRTAGKRTQTTGRRRTATGHDRTRTAGERSGSTGRTGATGRRERATWLGEGGQRDTSRRQRASAASAPGGGEWQRASRTYRRTEAGAVGERPSRVWTVLSGLRSVGPWLLVHLVFLWSAAMTAWLTVTQVNTHLAAGLPTLVLGVGLVATVAFVSVLHVVAVLYS